MMFLIAGMSILLFNGTSLHLRRAISLFYLLLIVIFFCSSYHNSDASNNWISYDYGIDLSQSAEINSTIITEGDIQLFPLTYLKEVEGFRCGLISWNPYFLGVSLGLVVLLLAWLIYVIVRGNGSINVKITLDPASKKHAFTVLVSGSPKPPVITDPGKYTSDMHIAGAQNRRFSATRVHSSARFKSIPAGKRYVHLFGTYEKLGTMHLQSRYRSTILRSGRQWCCCASKRESHCRQRAQHVVHPLVQ